MSTSWRMKRLRSLGKLLGSPWSEKFATFLLICDDDRNDFSNFKWQNCSGLRWRGKPAKVSSKRIVKCLSHFAVRQSSQFNFLFDRTIMSQHVWSGGMFPIDFQEAAKAALKWMAMLNWKIQWCVVRTALTFAVGWSRNDIHNWRRLYDDSLVYKNNS